MNDAYTIRTERLRAELVDLCHVKADVVHTQAICALFVNAPAHAITRKNAITATAFAPTDAQLAGGLLACGLEAFRAVYPDAFRVAMKHLGVSAR